MLEQIGANDEEEHDKEEKYNIGSDDELEAMFKILLTTFSFVEDSRYNAKKGSQKPIVVRLFGLLKYTRRLKDLCGWCSVSSVLAVSVMGETMEASCAGLLFDFAGEVDDGDGC
ncbi:hypothetical protein SADUNF_Sadunf05G0092200 [Salix dunnii]|uniref:Uncharacterized protein n=1 Tax=Salix dunnii TaxID=1413687 RepID=A0A835K5C0_9ROSI|nr:hypothetical protein SADUNF_Sadunf05G0092200 [Salix dunnii]